MENESLEQHTSDDSKYFLRIYRRIINDYLEDKKISFDEFVVLIWLTARANPYNGKVVTSYSGLTFELSSKYKKNDINKLCLSLKRKRYIYFQKQQGNRSSFTIIIDKYPLVSGYFLEIDKYFQNQDRSEAKSIVGVIAEDVPEATGEMQRWNTENKTENTYQNPPTSKRSSRSANIDNDIDNDNFCKNADLVRRHKFVESFIPNCNEEFILKEVAETLEEKTMKNVFVAMDKYGIELISQFLDYYSPLFQGNNGLKSPVAFFFSKLKEMKQASS